ncbi:MAG TPA: transglutaminase domain-containing protein [Solirubrobacteraceae bacterium]|nr:transglutaminase domain-containing protein [Solirubrobacteraceae bacterium]
MSSRAQVAVLPPLGRRAPRPSAITATVRERPALRLVAFAAFGLYGALRWASMLHPQPTWRSLGMLAVATAIVAIGIVLEGRARVLLVFAGIVALLAMFAFSGVPFSWVRHVRIWATADGIGQGLSGLPRTLIPYSGLNPWIREVILLGGGLLLFGSALILALAPRPLTETRRAVATVPLLTLAVLPSTINRPPGVYIHGLLLFGLLALFVWGERLDQDDGAMVVGVAAIAAATGMAFAPALDTHKPWINYQALTSSLAPGASESFDWSQRYGPLAWPRKGHEVIDIQAPHADYWKAQNLDVFNGRGWVAGEAAGSNQLTGVDPSSIQTWTQTLKVTLRAMKTTNVIAAGFAGQPIHISSAVAPGLSPGTWNTTAQLGPGDSYEVTAYDPHPTGGQLETAGDDYSDALIGYRSLFLPHTAVGTEIAFPAFGSHDQVQSFGVPPQAHPELLVKRSPYGRSYALARRLARRSATPYQFVTSVMSYLSHGFSYNENTPVHPYPLESFLFTDKYGYCQQFAGAMAMLLRMGGIPARVAVGFTSGSYNTSSHDYVVADIDAHAWVEAWFPHYGWVRFDPTPAVAPARGGKQAIVSTAPSLKPGGQGTPSVRGLGSGPAAAASAAGHHGGTTPLVWIVPLAVLLAAAVLLLASTRTSGEPSADEMLAELERALARSGRTISAGVTLAELERRFRTSPEAAAYIRTIRMARFAGEGRPPTTDERRALRTQLRAGLGMGGLLRGLWALPPRWRMPPLRRHPRPSTS